jgi:hypothetical protein
MRIEQFQTSTGEVFLCLPPLFSRLQVFEILFSKLRQYVDYWIEQGISNDTEIKLDNVIKNQLNQFLEFACDRSPLIPIDSLVILQDWINLRDAFVKVNVIDPFPSYRLDDEKKEGFTPKILSTGDMFSDNLGDFTASLENIAILLHQSVDLNTFYQVYNRVSQHRYWEIPENKEKAENKQTIEDCSDALHKLRGRRLTEEDFLDISAFPVQIQS